MDLYFMWIQFNKKKHKITKIQRKKINFINRIKYSEHKTFCICIEIYILYEGNIYDKLHEILST